MKKVNVCIPTIEICPDCRGAPKLVYIDKFNKSGWIVKCECGCHASLRNCPASAARRWNRMSAKLRMRNTSEFACDWGVMIASSQPVDKTAALVVSRGVS